MRGKKIIMCLVAVLAIGATVACNSKIKIEELKEDIITSEDAKKEANVNKDVISQINIEDEEMNDSNNSNENNETKDVVKQIEETNIFGKATEKPVMDENKTKKIGTYLEVIMTNKSKFTDENLIKFYKDNVENSNYKWVTLKLSKNKGIQFIGPSFVFNYGILDDNGAVIDILGSGNIMEDKIEYQKK